MKNLRVEGDAQCLAKTARFFKKLRHKNQKVIAAAPILEHNTISHLGDASVAELVTQDSKSTGRKTVGVRAPGAHYQNTEFEYGPRIQNSVPYPEFSPGSRIRPSIQNSVPYPELGRDPEYGPRIQNSVPYPEFSPGSRIRAPVSRIQSRIQNSVRIQNPGQDRDFPGLYGIEPAHFPLYENTKSMLFGPRGPIVLSRLGF